MYCRRSALELVYFLYRTRVVFVLFLTFVRFIEFVFWSFGRGIRWISSERRESGVSKTDWIYFSVDHDEIGNNNRMRSNTGNNPGSND